MSDEEILEGACLTLEQLCAAAALERDWLVRRVEEGLIPATGSAAAEWRFAAVHVVRARRMRDIERTYEAPPELAALVADMLEELDELRTRLKIARRT
jgi:chaperone modulatory protein CbpM